MSNHTLDIINYLERGLRLSEYCMASGIRLDIENVARELITCLKQGGKIITCGNGGSMCDAMHFAEELTGRYKADRQPLPAIAIADPSYLTCTANDYGYDRVFSRYIDAVGRPGDALLVFSTSGNSPNVLEALRAAKLGGLRPLALLGKGGGLAKPYTTASVVIPDVDDIDSGMIQEMHIRIAHLLIRLIEKEITDVSKT